MRIYQSLLLITLICNYACHSQKSEFTYLPANNDSVRSYINAVNSKKIKKFEGRNQKEIREIVEEGKESFLKELEDSTYIFDARINKYLNRILSDIYAANPMIDRKDFYFFLDKSPIPNAACYGNGIFTVNLGLFNMVDSDDELAFILCHEIAHYHLAHMDKKLLARAETMNSKEAKEKLRKVQRTAYGKRQAINDYVRHLSYNLLRHSRAAEIQADSLGMVFLSKTRFQKAAGIAAMKKLEQIDTLLFNTDSRIRQHFDLKGYPFKEAWLTPEETLFDLKETANDLALDKDSLKTHPDIPERLEKIKQFNNDGSALPISEDLKRIKKIAAENSINIFLDASRLDFALYQAMILYNSEEIEAKRYYNVVGSLLRRTYELKASHKFGKYVAPVSPFSDEKYLNEVKLFLHHLELKNVRKLGLEFCMQYADVMAGDAEFGRTTQFFKNLNPK